MVKKRVYELAKEFGVDSLAQFPTEKARLRARCVSLSRKQISLREILKLLELTAKIMEIGVIQRFLRLKSWGIV